MYDNLNYYKTFFAVAQTGNISKAANMLYISQPAISKSISKLEENLGVTLFVRTSKGVKLTPEGELLYSHVQKALQNLTQGEDEIKKINELGIGKLRIGASTSLCKQILLDYLKRFIVEYPHINITIDCHSTINTIKLLEEEKIDIGLICETDIPNGFIYDKLTDIHDIFIANDTYLDNLKLREKDDDYAEPNPWLFAGNLTSMVSSNDMKAKTSNDSLSTKEILEKSTLMFLDENNVTRTYVESYLSKEGIHPSQILEVNNMDLLVDFASIGMGVASVVREFATEALESGQVIELPLQKQIKKRTVGFVYADKKNKPTALNQFIEFCKKE